MQGSKLAGKKHGRKMWLSNSSVNEHFQNVSLDAVGVGAAAAEKQFTPIGYEVSGSVSTTRLTNVDVNSSATRVQVLALDSLQLPTCRFVKIDAEGMAPDVVVGMVNTIQHCRPVLFIQCESVDDGVCIRNAVHWKDYSFFLVRCAEYRSETFAGNTENLADFGDETAILCVPYEIRAMLIENNEWIEVNPFDTFGPQR